MNKKNTLGLLVVMVLASLTVPGLIPVLAEETMVIAHEDVFGKLSRPAVPFPHELHMDALASEGCGACHHSWDNTAGKLVYIEGEEFSCIECHLLRKKDGLPALREAYHGSCNTCHRERIKTGQTPSGPTTCGECHIQPD